MKLKLKAYGPKWLGWKRYIPYPLRATRLDLSLNPFGFWGPRFIHNKNLSEAAKREGAVIWYARFAWFQVSYKRWV